jgi:hypothetical protein
MDRRMGAGGGLGVHICTGPILIKGAEPRGMGSVRRRSRCGRALICFHHRISGLRCSPYLSTAALLVPTLSRSLRLLKLPLLRF